MPDASGQVETVQYETLSVLLLNEMQRQKKRLEDQERRPTELERQIEASGAR